MAATEALVWAAYAVLNLAVFGLVTSVRPRRPANLVAAVLFASNGTYAAILALGGGEEAGNPLQFWAELAEAPSLTALMLLPFLFPRRRLSVRGERALAALAGVHVAAAVSFVLGPYPAMAEVQLGYMLAFTAALVVGMLLLLEAILRGPSRSLQRQARFVLAAYAIKAMILTTMSAPVVAAGWGDVPVVASWLAYAGVLLAIPTAFLAARLGLVARGAPERPLRDDAFVVGAACLGFALPALGMSIFTEFLLLRPLLIAYGMLHAQLLDVDLRQHGWIAAAGILAGLSVVFATALDLLEGAGIEPGVAAGFAITVALGAAAAAAWPVARRLLPPDGDSGERRAREVYRAALEAARAERPDHGPANERVLQALRERLGISEREAAVLAASSIEGAAGAGLAPGRRFLGRYAVEALLGEGGTAQAFLARDEGVGRRVVLKVARAAGPEDKPRLLREARLLARLHHPAIVTVFDIEEVGGEVILVLEHLPGGSLAGRLRAGPLPLPDAVALADRLLQALDAAHREGIVHRDLKPGNILLGEDGQAKLADFGVARAAPGTGTVSGFTATGTTPGTLRYMSPEQVRGEALDGRSDLYALGAVLYEAIAGRHYVDLERRAGYDVLAGILDDPPRLPLPGVPPALNELLADLLAKDRAARPPTAAEALRRLRAAMHEDAGQAGPPQRAARRDRQRLRAGR